MKKNKNIKNKNIQNQNQNQKQDLQKKQNNNQASKLKKINNQFSNQNKKKQEKNLNNQNKKNKDKIERKKKFIKQEKNLNKQKKKQDKFALLKLNEIRKQKAKLLKELKKQYNFYKKSKAEQNRFNQIITFRLNSTSNFFCETFITKIKDKVLKNMYINTVQDIIKENKKEKEEKKKNKQLLIQKKKKLKIKKKIKIKKKRYIKIKKIITRYTIAELKKKQKKLLYDLLIPNWTNNQFLKFKRTQYRQYFSYFNEFNNRNVNFRSQSFRFHLYIKYLKIFKKLLRKIFYFIYQFNQKKICNYKIIKKNKILKTLCSELVQVQELQHILKSNIYKVTPIYFQTKPFNKRHSLAIRYLDLNSITRSSLVSLRESIPFKRYYREFLRRATPSRIFNQKIRKMSYKNHYRRRKIFEKYFPKIKKLSKNKRKSITSAFDKILYINY